MLLTVSLRDALEMPHLSSVRGEFIKGLNIERLLDYWRDRFVRYSVDIESIGCWA